MAKFFIDRPVFAIVVAIVISLAGVISLANLPISQYPNIVLPTVNVFGYYQGASADVVEQAVGQPIEQQVNGVEGMLYMDSQSASDGSYSLNVTFALDRDPDIATVQVQNRVTQAQGSLPSEVNDNGVMVTKQTPDTLMYFALHSPNGTYDDLWLNNYGSINVVDVIKRVKGVGGVKVFGSDFGMRVWLHPDKMARLGITTTDVFRVIQEQNVQAPAGAIGQYPSPKGQAFQLTVRVQGRLVEVSEFQNVIVRAQADGSYVRIKDIARVELAARDYKFIGGLNGKPAALFAVNLTPDASALETSALINAELDRLESTFPPDVACEVFIDNTIFVQESLREVIITFVEALLLVLLVVFLFLQTFRATLIPMLAVPVSLIGTFASFTLLGFTINTLTLFGMVLAIGIVVDDAIVVVEAVEHHMRHSRLGPKEATRKAMEEVSGPVVAIALVLASVFVPVAFLGGIAGQLYKQFAVTVAISTVLSAFIALSLTPALCVTLLKPHVEGGHRGLLGRFFDRFNAWFERTTARYTRTVRGALRHAFMMMLTLGILCVAAFALMKVVPGGFVPEEDQGYFMGAINLPDGASLDRTKAATAEVETKIRAIKGVKGTMTVVGYDMLTSTIRSNAAMLAVSLEPWDERKGIWEQVKPIMFLTMKETRPLGEANTLVFNPPPIPGMGNTGGFTMMVQDRVGTTPEALADVADAVVEAARKRPEIGMVYSTFNVKTPSYQLDVDRDKAKKLGVAVNDVFSTLQVFLGGANVNDFSRFGRTYKVSLQAEPEFRNDIHSIDMFYVRSSSGAMVPLKTLVTSRATSGPASIERFNVYRTASVGGSAASGVSSGAAMAAMEEVAAQVLPSGFGYEWSSLARQEKESSGKAPIVFGMAIVFVFLFLAALYESWSVPFAVLLAVPLGVLGALASQWARGLENNVYAQIGLILLIGLAAKNAILIVEFAKANKEKGMDLWEAAVDAAQLRLRPILMTSLAFILGVVPLVIASGAGSASRHALGTSVFGGMIFATGLAIFFVPVLFVVVSRIAEGKRGGAGAVESRREGEV